MKMYFILNMGIFQCHVGSHGIYVVSLHLYASNLLACPLTPAFTASRDEAYQGYSDTSCFSRTTQDMLFNEGQIYAKLQRYSRSLSNSQKFEVSGPTRNPIYQLLTMVHEMMLQPS